MHRILPVLLAVSLALAAPSHAESKSVPPPTTVELARQAEAELRENILPFWLEHARDRERGGFYGSITKDLAVDKNAPRGALLTARILWTFSAAYRRYHDPAYLEMARWAYDDLVKRFWDHDHGGVYWLLAADGKTLDARKLLYVQAFTLYGLGEFHRASGDRAALEHAIALYRLVEARARDRQRGGYFEEFTREWKPSRDRGPGSGMGSLGQKSQNVHLHVMEAYTTLLRAWPDAGLRQNLRDVVDIILTRMLHPQTHHLGLFFDDDWTPRSDKISFGHDIEFSWLVVDSADALDDDALKARVRRIAVQIADATLERGIDPDGGVLSEANPQGYTNTYKEWWAQAEAAVGFVNAFQLSRRPEHLAAAQRTWNFISTQLVDRTHGEWRHGVTREGQPSSAPKVSFWKCPYHNGRACLEIVARLSDKH